jgi:putative ABC transport system permease protein
MYSKRSLRACARVLLNKFQAPSVEKVAPVISEKLGVTYGGKTTNTYVTGVSESYADLRKIKTAEGTFITENQNLGKVSVIVIGSNMANTLFERRNVIVGETIYIENPPFRVVGVLELEGGGAYGSDDNSILVLISTAQTRLIHRDLGSVDRIMVSIVDPKLITQASEEISQILRIRHRSKTDADDFTVYTLIDDVDTINSITGVMTIFLGSNAGIFLLVGGIGIMNIMLVSVTERIHEIGLRKALGARKRDILTKFLVESSLLCFIGGLLGIILGWLIAFFVGKIAANAGIPFSPLVSLSAILLSTIFSGSIGLLFGLFPAIRASRFEPIEALRY